MKPGIKSTEFWMTMLAQVLGLLVTVGVLSSGEVSIIVEASESVIVAVTAFLAAVTPLLGGFALVWKYVQERTKLKVEDLKQ